MSVFEDTIRALARKEGHPVTSEDRVNIQMSHEWSGYSEYTITNLWDSFTVTCGSTFERTYEDEDESRLGTSQGPLTALAKLFDDLASLDNA